MTKQEFLAASLPYGIKVLPTNTNRYGKTYLNKPCLVRGMDIDCYNQHYINTDAGLGWTPSFFIYESKPIIRPITDITKLCIQANYNGGEPFVPIVKLAEMFGYEIPTKIGELIAPISVEPFICVMQLFKWHFWPGMPEGEEVVYVTDDFNPYK